MKRGIITVSLLMVGSLFLTPLANASFAKGVTENTTPVEVKETTDKVQSSTEAKEETTQVQEVKEEALPKEEAKEEQTVSKEEVKEDIKEEAKVEETTPIEEVATEDKGMTQEEAQVILNKYISEVEKADFTYTYQGDENTFKAIKEKGIRGYVFLPNIETDMAYLVDKDSGNIYFFHPSGYFELLQ